MIEIDQMKPGDELDALVAETVFSCKVEKYGPNRDLYRCGCSDRRPHNQIWNELCDDLLADYSRSIEAAWKVVERMRDLKFQMEMRTYHTYFEGPGVNTMVRFLESPPADWMMKRAWEPEGNRETVDSPLAICRAALKVLKFRRYAEQIKEQ